MSRWNPIDHQAVVASYLSGKTQAEVAVEFGIVPTSVGRILRETTSPMDRAEVAAKNLKDAHLARGPRAQERKIANGLLGIYRSGDVLEVLTGGITFLLDACDEPLLRRYAWRATRARRLVRTLNFKNIFIYHDIMGVEPSRKQVVDHINRDPADNRRINLRICTYSENGCNRTGSRGALHHVPAYAQYQERHLGAQ